MFVAVLLRGRFGRGTDPQRDRLCPKPEQLAGPHGGGKGRRSGDGGLVIVVSAYDWNEDATPRGGWLGGSLDENGTMVSPTTGLEVDRAYA